MKVLACDKVDPAALAMLRAAGHEVSEANALKGAALTAALAGVSGLVVRGATKVTADVLKSSPLLKVVVRAGTGLDNVDRAAAAACGVQVMNTPNANSVSVAELTFGLMLALPNLLPLPHLGASTAEAQKRAGTEAAQRLIDALAKLR